MRCRWATPLQKKLIDLDTVKEVISDLDITKLTTGGAGLSEPEPEPFFAPKYAPPAPTHPVSRPAARQQKERGEILSPEEAAAYMQEVALKLKKWQRSLEQSVNEVRPKRAVSGG